MPLLRIHHKTEYRYAHPVAFGEHRIMLRPRDGHDLRVLSGSLEITPAPMSLRWIHDVFGNSVAIAAFDERAEALSFVSTATVEHNPAEAFALTPDDPAYFYPFPYDDEEFQYPVRHDAWHPPVLHLPQASRAWHPASARHPADEIRHLPRLRAVHDRGAAPARHRRAFRVGLYRHPRRPRPSLCRRWQYPCLGPGLPAERRLDRVRSHQRHRRHPRPRAGRGGARPAPGDPAARNLPRFGRRLGRHGGQHRRFLPQRSGRGLIMQIKVGFEITYAAAQPTPMVTMLSIHPSRRQDIIGAETIIAEPDVRIGFYRDSFDNICGRLVAPAGGVTLRGKALVRDTGLPDAIVPDALQWPIDRLPDDALLYLMASRYCETDKLTDVAWSLFGKTQAGWPRVAAICDFVHDRVTFGYQHAHYTKSAHDVYEQRAGVCRDFAHLALTFCRCMGIPARYCTGYMGDIGICL